MKMQVRANSPDNVFDVSQGRWSLTLFGGCEPEDKSKPFVVFDSRDCEFKPVAVSEDYYKAVRERILKHRCNHMKFWMKEWLS